MNIDSFKKNHDALIIEIENLKGDNCSPIPDGVIDIEQYLNSNLKILWINKEVNSEGDEDDWSLIDVIKDMSTVFSLKQGFTKTFAPITYIIYGIFENKNWIDIPNVQDEPKIADILKSIAHINLKKLPGKNVANNRELEFHLTQNDIVKKQIELFQPNVIICGNTFEILDKTILPDIFGEDYNKMNRFEQNKMIFWYDEKRIFVDAYHPQRPPMKQQVYCDTIIDNILTWQNEKKMK